RAVSKHLSLAALRTADGSFDFTTGHAKHGRLPVLLLCLHVNFSKNSFLLLPKPKFLAESGCKSTTFENAFQIFMHFFFKKNENFRISLQN
ncbi:MAG: hypothetical protein IKT00_01945, partial [Prevotella sp.]|nr:hypothetical protein [Prevotella sp.]